MKKDNVWFISDLHLQHKNVLEYCPKRKDVFGDIDTHDSCIIKRWNDKISKDDTVFVLGDCFFGDKKNGIDKLNQLNGRKHLVVGNHDKHNLKNKDFNEVWETIQDYKEIKLEDVTIILFHYPIESWNMMMYKSLHFHGHIHSLYPSRARLHNRFDVGLDNTPDFSPQLFQDVIKLAK